MQRPFLPDCHLRLRWGRRFTDYPPIKALNTNPLWEGDGRRAPVLHSHQHPFPPGRSLHPPLTSLPASGSPHSGCNPLFGPRTHPSAPIYQSVLPARSCNLWGGCIRDQPGDPREEWRIAKKEVGQWCQRQVRNGGFSTSYWFDWSWEPQYLVRRCSYFI